MSATKIEWCDYTINPVVGCSKISPGCDNCYAERFAARHAKNPNPKIAAKYAGVVDASGKWTVKLSGLDLSVFKLPKKPCRVFVGSMTDMFHPGLDDNKGQGMLALLDLFRMYPDHTFMLLTKRPERMLSDIEWLIAQDGDLPENLWLGVTVCNQDEADEKIPLLLATSAAKRFVSVEPMLGPVDIGKYLYGSYECALSCGKRIPFRETPEKRCVGCGFEGPDDYETWGDGDSEVCPECHSDTDFDHVCPDCGTYMVHDHPDTPNIDWVICGAETGPGKRRMEIEWALSLREQCHRHFSKTPFFFKKDSTGSRLLDGCEWNEVPV